MNGDEANRAAAVMYGHAEELCVRRSWRAALEMFDRALALRPHDARSARNHSTALMQTGHWRAAIELGRAALEMEPGHAAVHVTVGISARALGDIDGAIAEYQKALAVQPECMEALNNLANIYRETGRVRRAIDCYQRALDFHPDRADVASNRLYALYYDADFDGPSLLREHRAWAARFAAPLGSGIRPHGNERSPGRRLRVGYVSADFRAHVLGVSLMPLLGAHDHGQFEIFGYSGVPPEAEDEVSRQLRGGCDTWRQIHSLSDSLLADLIRADQIDILVDLTLHMASNRLLVFARKAAPVQVTYLAYCGTSGMGAMDYRLSDPHLDPPEADLSCYSERTMRLAGGYWCYQPPPGAPPIREAPALRNGYVTFGCLNSFSKVSPQTLDLWAAIVRDVPGSRLVLHCPEGLHRKGVLDRFLVRGVTPDRLELLPYQQWSQYMETYQRIDVGLDPFPYCGGITTLDALWMGVPVLTLSGRTAVGRGGRSIVSALELPELAAASKREYAQMAADFGRWIQLRPDLRRRMSSSPLLDAARLARQVEEAYRAMWINWALGVEV